MPALVRWGNCYIYAIRQWVMQGGYLILSKSRHGWWIHAEWSPDRKTFHSFDPIWSKTLWNYKFPPLLFKGRVRSYIPKS